MAASKPRKPLDRDRILDAAGPRIDRDGLAAFSMRGLAKDLGVEPMSLYHWFPSRDHVMDGLLDRFAARVVVPTDGTWEERLGAAAHGFREAARAHPGAFPYIAVHRFNTATCLALLEGVLGVLAEVHADPGRRAAAFRLYIHWLVGFCLDETSGFSKGPSAAEPVDDATIAERFPRVAALGPYNRPAHFDALFESGLAAVLAGIRALEPGKALTGR